MKNKLHQYKIKTFSTWAEVAEKTGMTNKQLIRIAKMNTKQILTLRLNTYYVIKTTLDVDLLEKINI